MRGQVEPDWAADLDGTAQPTIDVEMFVDAIPLGALGKMQKKKNKLRERFKLDPVVGRGRVGGDAVRWQGAPTQWADAHKEKQRSQHAVARLNRMRSVRTCLVMAGGKRNLNRHAASAAAGSGQLPHLGSSVVTGVVARVQGGNPGIGCGPGHLAIQIHV